MDVIWFNWPSPVGGADTKFWHTLRLLRGRGDITVVPNEPRYLETPWREKVLELGHSVSLAGDLPERMSGWAVSLCNGPFLDAGLAADMKRRGLRVAWSSEMMWHFPGEREAVEGGVIDAVLYVSQAQRAELEPGYLDMIRGAEVPQDDTAEAGAESGVLRGKSRDLPWFITGNYIDPAEFPFQPRGAWEAEGRPFTIGRLSRPDPAKFPHDFPKFYERLGLREPVKFRVMGWSDDLTARWCEHAFGPAWDLLPVNHIPALTFLQSLDVLVYNTSPRFRESWGRAVAEAMLTGVVPILPRGRGHHLQELVSHGQSGFLCDTDAEFGRYARLLQNDCGLLAEMSRAARRWAETELFDGEEHWQAWRRLFESSQ